MPTATAPTRVGYTFNGYFDTSNATGGTQYYNANMASASVWNKHEPNVGETYLLYARWTVSMYTVTLDPNGGTDAVKTVQATFDSAMPMVLQGTATALTAPLRIG